MRLSYCGSARWALLLLVLGLLAALCAAQESPSPTGQAATAKPVTDTSPTPDQQPATSGIRLGNGDLISISVYGVPELSQDLRINDEGNVSMALIGSVHVAGLTPEAAQNSIEEKFRSGGFLNNPHVTLLIKEMATQGISVMGEVARPGIYPLMGPRRLYDVIAAAGGLSQRAGQLDMQAWPVAHALTQVGRALLKPPGQAQRPRSHFRPLARRGQSAGSEPEVAVQEIPAAGIAF